MSSWREKLERLALVCPGWVDDEHHGRWGLPADEGALRQAERFLTAMGKHADSPDLYLDIDPLDGDISLAWYGRTQNLAVWAEAGCIGMLIAYHKSDPPGRWAINHDALPFDKAVAIAKAWLSGIW